MGAKFLFIPANQLLRFGVTLNSMGTKYYLLFLITYRWFGAILNSMYTKYSMRKRKMIINKFKTKIKII